MKLQQFRYLLEVVKQNLNISEAAIALHTSQPGVSKQIKLLEDELGVDVFVRHGKRVIGVTPPGRQILEIAGRILGEANNLSRVGEEFTQQSSGRLTIATTHTQARYALPSVIPQFIERYPQVKFSIKQGSPTQICQMVIEGQADIAIATEGIDQFSALAMLPCYQWNRSIIVPHAHALAAHARAGSPKLSLAEVAAYPLITYDFAFAGRNKINRAFTDAGIEPNVILTAIDADIIKTYVGLGLGVGILASMAFEPNRDQDLTAIDASHLFEPSTTRIGFRKGDYLRGFVLDFIQAFAPHVTKGEILEAGAL